MATISMRQFFAETQAGGDQLHWPGTSQGFPVRGNPGLLTDAEYRSIPHRLEYHSKRFDLWDQAQHAEFNKIMNHIVNHLYFQHKREDHWMTEHSAMSVWLEWIEVYGEAPAQLSAPVGGNNGVPTASL